MKFREKLKQEHPEEVRKIYIGGCKGCPSDYGYEPKRIRCPAATNTMQCEECWDREIPEKQEDEPCSERDEGCPLDHFREVTKNDVPDANVGNSSEIPNSSDLISR